MQIPSIDSIPKIGLHSFLAVLQSLTQAHVGKHHPLALDAVHPETFKKKTWADCYCNDDDIQTILLSFSQMFSVPTIKALPYDSIYHAVDTIYRQWEHGPRTISFFTSGSTGTPKKCIHSETDLRQEVASLIPLCKGCKRTLVAVPLHHLYGFVFGLLLPQVLSISIVTEAPLPTSIAHQITEGDMVIGMPLLWARMMDLLETTKQNIVLFSSTAPLPSHIFEHFTTHNFTLIEIFGSSETGALAYRKQAKAPFTLLSHYARHGHEENSPIFRTLPDAKCDIQSLQDTVDWLDARHFLPRGRKDHAVQVGGINVFPSHVENILGKHPAIKECSVRLMRPEEGFRLKAFIVVEDNYDSTVLKKDLRSYVKSYCTKEEQPVTFTFGHEIPRNSIGKLSDW